MLSGGLHDTTENELSEIVVPRLAEGSAFQFGTSHCRRIAEKPKQTVG
jgi:hypothetical protein